MQLLARDSTGRMVNAQHAIKHQNYFCIECDSFVRLRGGIHRQDHFYHLQPNRICRLNGKSMVHLQVQLHLKHLLFPSPCQLEYRFSEIKRIADVFWEDRGIVWEIQCSSITAQEVQERNSDYRRLGVQVIWILHDSRFNQWRMTAAEWILRKSPFYFTNMNVQGKGYIYDQWDSIYQGFRQKRLGHLPINVCLPCPFKKNEQLANDAMAPKLIRLRMLHWPLYFPGDLVSLYLEKRVSLLQEEYFSAIDELEKREDEMTLNGTERWLGWKRRWQKWILYPYRCVFQLFLERASKN